MMPVTMGLGLELGASLKSKLWSCRLQISQPPHCAVGQWRASGGCRLVDAVLRMCQESRGVENVLASSREQSKLRGCTGGETGGMCPSAEISSKMTRPSSFFHSHPPHPSNTFAMAASANLPDELKHIGTYLQRAAEVQERDPVISYYGACVGHENSCRTAPWKETLFVAKRKAAVCSPVHFYQQPTMPPSLLCQRPIRATGLLLNNC